MDLQEVRENLRKYDDPISELNIPQKIDLFNYANVKYSCVL